MDHSEKIVDISMVAFTVEWRPYNFVGETMNFPDWKFDWNQPIIFQVIPRYCQPSNKKQFFGIEIQPKTQHLIQFKIYYWILPYTNHTSSEFTTCLLFNYFLIFSFLIIRHFNLCFSWSTKFWKIYSIRYQNMNQNI